MEDRMTIPQFIAQHGISSRSKYLGVTREGMWDGYSRWSVTLSAGGRSMTAVFHQGYAVRNDPKTEDVLSCLATDAASVEDDPDVRSWTTEMGFNWSIRDERLNAMRAHRAIQSQKKHLEAMLGTAAYNQLLWDVEPL